MKTCYNTDNCEENEQLPHLWIIRRNETMNTIDNLAINSIRILSADAIQKAKSGHPGLPLGAAPMAYELWTRHMNHNPADPQSNTHY